MNIQMLPVPDEMIETDNRDSKETWLNFGLQVRVNPQDLMMNVIENLPEPLNLRYEPIFRCLLNCIEKDLDLDTELNNRAEYDSLIQIVTDTLQA